MLVGCSGPTVKQKKTIAQLQADGDFMAAAYRIRSARDEYGPANEALYDLDLAQALADAGKHAEADRFFAEGQDRLEKLWTLSVTKSLGSALANENVDDWRGEDFEHALTFVLRALNFIAMGHLNEALIEAKRSELYLDNRARTVPRARTYCDDAFARWLAARLYEDLGNSDDARISQETADRAYADYERSYGVSAPPPPAGAGTAEITVVFLDGPAPHKVRRSGGGPLGLILQTSYPIYELTGATASLCSVSAGGMQTNLATVEDIDAIASKDLEERLLTIRTRSTLRAAAKLAGTAFGVDATNSEFADVRSWSTLPARIGVANLRVPAVPVDVHVRCVGAGGTTTFDSVRHIDPKAGKRAWVIERGGLGRPVRGRLAVSTFIQP